MEIIIAKRINELMAEKGLNQTKLAEKICVRQHTVSTWLLKKKEPSITSLWKLADFFGVDVDYLIGRKND